MSPDEDNPGLGITRWGVPVAEVDRSKVIALTEALGPALKRVRRPLSPSILPSFGFSFVADAGRDR